MTKDDEQNNLDDSFSIINRIPESSIPENRPRTLPGKQNYPSPPNPRKKSESAHVPVREYSLMCFFFSISNINIDYFLIMKLFLSQINVKILHKIK